MNRLRAGLRVAPLFAFALLAACEEEIPRSNTRGGGAPPPAPSAQDAPSGDEKETQLVLSDEDFVESERNRDPFRSYASAFRAKAPEQMQRHVIMPTTSVGEMRLIAIVTGTARPRAMLVDPLGVGHVVERGDFIGRPTVIQATGSVAMTLNWRVDRIRDNEVVLTQQDPTDATRTSMTRVLTLNEEVASKL